MLRNNQSIEDIIKSIGNELIENSQLPFNQINALYSAYLYKHRKEKEKANEQLSQFLQSLICFICKNVENKELACQFIEDLLNLYGLKIFNLDLKNPHDYQIKAWDDISGFTVLDYLLTAGYFEYCQRLLNTVAEFYRGENTRGFRAYISTLTQGPESLLKIAIQKDCKDIVEFIRKTVEKSCGGKQTDDYKEFLLHFPELAPKPSLKRSREANNYSKLFRQHQQAELEYVESREEQEPLFKNKK